MKSLKLTLWIAAIGCLAAVPFIVLPWSIVENIILWLGFEPLPDSPVVIYLFRIVSPKNIDRNENIKKRLYLSKAKLEGTLHELNEHKVEVDEELKTCALETIESAKNVSEKINGMLSLFQRFETKGSL